MIKLREQNARLAELFKETSARLADKLSDLTVNEILVNPDGYMWVDCFNGMTNTGIKLTAKEIKRIICLIAGMANKSVTANDPAIAIEIANTGERFQGLLPPLVEQPSFSIRKHCATIFNLEDYISDGCLTVAQAKLIKKYIQERKNIVLCGGTSTGKTTFANALLQEIAKYEQRILILEDTKELQCSAKNVVQLKTTKTKTMRDLIKISLRLRPDRIIVGEVRGGEALELLKAWGTGHPGGLATVHASSAMDCLYRMEDLVLEAVAGRQTRLIANSIDVIIYLERINNKRQVKEIVQVDNFFTEESDYVLKKV